MKSENELKEIVKEKYAGIAIQDKDKNAVSCCGATSCTDEVYNIMSDDYSSIEGYTPSADLGLGCGLPTEYARIHEGDTVIDLGSGAGNDCFIARKIAGEKGKVIGIDFTGPMISLARKNAEKLNYNNVEFRFGDIEKMPVDSDLADVIVSNCVLNLVPNKENVFKEIFRVLKPGGHFSISDIVLQGELPEKWQEVAELYAGCVSGAILKEDYLALIYASGFKNVIIQKEKTINVPSDILKQYLPEAEAESYLSGGSKISSITVFAEKPALESINCCLPGSSCC